METNKTMNPSVAIIVAGILIAGSIIYVHKTGPTTTTTTQVKDAVTAAPEAETIALSLGMKKTALEQCVTNQTYKSIIDTQTADGKAAGLKGTPYTVFVRPDGKTVGLSGAQSYADAKAVIDAALAGKEDPSNPSTAINVAPVSASDHIRGDINAPIKMIEFSDLQCPFCQKFHPVMQQVMQNYPGQVVWIYRHYPLVSIHDQALARALTAECVSATLGQDAFWKFVDQMFK